MSDKKTDSALNILITSAGQRVSLVRAFQKEIGKLHHQNRVYTVDLNPILAPACHVSDGFRKVPRATDSTYIAVLLDVCAAWHIGMVVPTIDTELQILARHKQLFLDQGVELMVSSPEFVDKCRDKRLINQFFSDKGIDIPEQYSPRQPKFPLFIKPYDGSLSKDTYLVKTPNEWTDEFLANPKLMYMEYIDPVEHDEYTVDTYYDRAGYLKCAIPRKRIFVRAGEVNKGVTVKNEMVGWLKEKLGHIEGAVGCLTMQFFLNRNTKRLIGIEINPRFGGGFPLSYLAGGNFPAWLIQEYFLGETIEYDESWEDKLLMLRYDDEILVKNHEG